MELGSETMLGFWFGVVMIVMCVVCAMPDLLKKESDVRQEQEFTAVFRAHYHIAQTTGQPATADAQTGCLEGHEPESVLPSAARHCADHEGHGVTECLRHQVSPGIGAPRSKACAGHPGLRAHECHIPIENALCSLSVGE